MTSGRVVTELALRYPMRVRGWKPRAPGWFTEEIAADSLGVVTLGAASAHSERGTAQVTLYVGLRHEPTEQLVSQLRDRKDEGYRQRTAIIGIGYLLPSRSWHEWLIRPDNAEERAHHLASCVSLYAEPYLRGLASDRADLLAAVKASPGFDRPSGGCRAAVLLAQQGHRDQATASVEERINGLGTRADAAADTDRKVATRIVAWLAA